jgi:hypothetical protein
MNAKTFALVGLFIVIVIVLLFRCSTAKSAEFDLRGGASFGPGRTGPVLGLQIYEPIGNQVDVFAGTIIWGKTSVAATTWDWHAGFRTCRWSVCASLGASYLQNVDAVNGAHTNYYLGLSYVFGWSRIRSIDYVHLSDLGTTPVNKGRNAALVSVRLQ